VIQARGGGLWAALLLTGCAANCLRDTDCDDAHVCRHDRCELPGSSAPDGGLGNARAADAGALVPSMPSVGAGGSASGAGGSTSGAGGSASDAGGSASVPDTSSGGSATGGRENLDASGG